MRQHNIYFKAVIVHPHIKQLLFLNDEQCIHNGCTAGINCLNMEQEEDAPDGECKLVVEKNKIKKIWQ